MHIDDLSAWNEAHRIADELRVRIHLASMDMRDRWALLEPRLEGLEKTVFDSSEHLTESFVRERYAVRDALRVLRDELHAAVRGDYVTGW